MKITSSSSLFLATLAVSSSTSSMAAPAESPSSLQQSSVPSSSSLQSVAMAGRDFRFEGDGPGVQEVKGGLHHNPRHLLDVLKPVLSDDLIDKVNALLKDLGVPLRRRAKSAQADPNGAILDQSDITDPYKQRDTRADAEGGDSASASSIPASTTSSYVPLASPNATTSGSAQSTMTTSFPANSTSNTPSSATGSADSAPTTTLSGSSRRGIAARRVVEWDAVGDTSTSGLTSTSTSSEPSYTSSNGVNATSTEYLKASATPTDSVDESESTSSIATSTLARRNLRFLREDVQMDSTVTPVAPSNSTSSIGPSDTSSASFYSTSTDAAGSTAVPSSTESTDYANPTVLVRAPTGEPSSSVDGTPASENGTSSASPTSTSMNSTSTASPTLPVGPPNSPVDAPRPPVPAGASPPSGPILSDAPPLFPGMKAVDPSTSSVPDAPVAPTSTGVTSSTSWNATDSDSSTMAASSTTGSMPTDTSTTASEADPTEAA